MRIAALISCAFIALLGAAFIGTADRFGDVLAGVVALAYGGGNIAYMLVGPGRQPFNAD